MSRSERHQLAIKLTTQEYAALAADGERYGVPPTTMALCHILAGMQGFRHVVPDLTEPASRATYALKAAADALRKAGAVDAADDADAAGQELSDVVRGIPNRNVLIVAPGWRLDAYRHRIDWKSGEPALEPGFRTVRTSEIHGTMSIQPRTRSFLRMSNQSDSTSKQPAEPKPAAQPRLPKPTTSDPGVSVRTKVEHGLGRQRPAEE